jgi:hypothetical protein
MDFVEQHEADAPFFTWKDPEYVAAAHIGEPLIEHLSGRKNNICGLLSKCGPRENHLVTSRDTFAAACLTAYETLHVTFDVLSTPEQFVSTGGA